jgi:nucleolar protein 15
MRAYFSQFGDITRLRLSRNRVTGRSKHYAFIEFASSTVAKIVAETMDNYLMYGHILKCKYVPQERLHPDIWRGANRRFKKIPWNRIEKKRLERGKTREKWSKSIEREQAKRLTKAEKLKALGYELELPTLMSVDKVAIREKEDKPIKAAESIANQAKEEQSAGPLQASPEQRRDKETGNISKPSKRSKENKRKKSSSFNPTRDTLQKATTIAPTSDNATKTTTAPSSKKSKKGQKT